MNWIEETISADFTRIIILWKQRILLGLKQKEKKFAFDTNKYEVNAFTRLVTKRFTVRGRFFVSFSRSSLDKPKWGL